MRANDIFLFNTATHKVVLGFRLSLQAALHPFHFPTLGHSWFRGFSSGSPACFPLPHTGSLLVSGFLFRQRCIRSIIFILWLLQIFTYMQTYAYRHAICIQCTCHMHTIHTYHIHTIYIQSTYIIHTMYIKYTCNVHAMYMQNVHDTLTLYTKYTNNIHTCMHTYIRTYVRTCNMHIIHMKYTYNIHTIHIQYT